MTSLLKAQVMVLKLSKLLIPDKMKKKRVKLTSLKIAQKEAECAKNVITLIKSVVIRLDLSESVRLSSITDIISE